MRVELFDFDLPPECIALRPAVPRDSAKLLAVTGNRISDHVVSDLPNLLGPHDILVFNDTKVIPAQLSGTRGEARIGATLHKRVDLRRWQAFVRNAKRLRIGDKVDFGSDVSAEAEARLDDGSFILRFLGEEPVELLLERAGTMPTSLRLLESATGADGIIRPFEGDTDIFITPGYEFRAIDGLMTNFHLPKSTLFMLVSALMGLETMQAAYAHAIAGGYRFYSYGDSSLLLP